MIPNLEELRRGLRVLLAPERVTELRAIAEAEPDYRRPHPASGYFNHLQALVEELARLEQAEGNCTLPNPVGPALLVRTANRIKPAKSRGDDD